ncbi:hypothetical protein PUNSTDRAFT_48864 [Punctularia strigosozonata HHB-11173 SS5]|uniref:uncharacterized protein n=1 Tax=Punctularia strigosozonata (strain HHB-11173) TaxID=741275 RepID=UPI00044171D2|nr:uncharacterized protein PUNSTDRAFT_48864 [Punctularia strigosozonata HHB-11173 SS5]EIN14003.1 hypothetical protein PUNSTDRAFT_48864 [Punctularia strigosozonata HHB-11173 SS5]
MLSTVQEIISILPISYYPVTRPWRRKKLTISILATLSIVVYAALTTWNVLTQGREPSYTTVLRTTMPSQHDTKTKCQVRTLQVGDMIYASPSGAFAWSITGVDSGAMQGSDFDVGVNYAGAAMQANVTSLGMFYYWSIQSFKYGVCANATVPQLSGKGNNGHSVAKATDGTVLTTVITMCAHFDLDSSDVPAWATAAQTPIQNAFYDLAIYFQT